MANEIQVTSSLRVLKRDTDGTLLIDYTAKPTNVIASMSGNHGPEGGIILATTAGTDFDFPDITAGGGFVRFMNQGPNRIYVGLFDSANAVFHPFMALEKGESFVLRLAHTIFDGFANLRAQAVGSNSYLLAEAFDA